MGLQLAGDIPDDIIVERVGIGRSLARRGQMIAIRRSELIQIVVGVVMFGTVWYRMGSDLTC